MHAREFQSYHIRAVFLAPLSFAFGWCTDYSADDPKIAGEDKAIHLARRVVKRSRRRVIFEQIYDEGRGWAWERHIVTVLPPDRWHSDGFGNYQESHLDYQLTELSRERTRFDMNWQSRPTALSAGPPPSKARVERFVRELWRRRARALERAYRASRERVGPKTTR